MTLFILLLCKFLMVHEWEILLQYLQVYMTLLILLLYKFLMVHEWEILLQYLQVCSLLQAVDLGLEGYGVFALANMSLRK